MKFLKEEIIKKDFENKILKEIKNKISQDIILTTEEEEKELLEYAKSKKRKKNDK